MVGTGISLLDSNNIITITNSSPASAMTLATGGVGADLVNNGSSPNFKTKGIIGGTGITISSGTQDITITNSSPASSISFTNSGTGTSLINSASGAILTTRGLLSVGNGFTITTSGADITLGLPTTADVTLTALRTPTVYVKGVGNFSTNITTLSQTTNMPLVLPFAQGVANSYLKNDGTGTTTWSTISNPTFTGSTSLLAGTSGSVIAPAATNQNYNLIGDGTWGYQRFLGARKFASAATLINNSTTPVSITLGTTSYTSGSITTSSTNSITIVVAGYYTINARVSMLTTAATQMLTIYIRSNSAGTLANGSVTSTTVTTLRPIANVTALLSAGEIITLGATNNILTQSSIVGTADTYLEVNFLGKAST